MGKEFLYNEIQVMRAIRSLEYNRKIKPVIEGRIERAETKIRRHLMSNRLTSSRIGAYQVDIDERGELAIEQLPTDDWEQLNLPVKARAVEAV